MWWSKKEEPCTHPDWLPVDERGFQQCSKCGHARFVHAPECQHHWLPTDEDGFQTCTKCGETKRVKTPECEHDFEERDNCMFCKKCGMTVQIGPCIAHEWVKVDEIVKNKPEWRIIYVSECKKCGKMKTESVTADGSLKAEESSE